MLLKQMEITDTRMLMLTTIILVNDSQPSSIVVVDYFM